MARTVLKHAKSVDIDRRQLLASVSAMTIGSIIPGAAPGWAFVRECLGPKELNDPAAEVKPANPSEEAYWFTYPEDTKTYEFFVRYVLDLASGADLNDGMLGPLTGGMANGIDIRATSRYWQMEDSYVPEPSPSSGRVTNGLIDWTSRNENSWILQNTALAPPDTPYSDATSRGWIDPDLLGVGSVSWQVRNSVELRSKPFLMQRNYREVSLITLDAPTWIEGESGTRQSFYDIVIKELIDLDLIETPENNNIYAWLEVMFKFCRNKPFAYFSLYEPSPRILSIGSKFGVRVIHVPLTLIPERMLQRHQSFKFMRMTPSQWEDLLERMGESNRASTTKPATERTESMAKKTTSKSSLIIPADEDVTSEALGTIFAIVGVQPSKPKE
jgi:hypothetical protein